MSLKNPFPVVGYHGPELFCDREKETGRLSTTDHFSPCDSIICFTSKIAFPVQISPFGTSCRAVTTPSTPICRSISSVMISFLPNQRHVFSICSTKKEITNKVKLYSVISEHTNCQTNYLITLIISVLPDKLTRTRYMPLERCDRSSTETFSALTLILPFMS